MNIVLTVRALAFGGEYDFRGGSEGVDMSLDKLREVLIWSLVINYGVLLLDVAPLAALWLATRAQSGARARR